MLPTQSINSSPWPRPGRGSASVPHLWLSQPVAILMNRPHFTCTSVFFLRGRYFFIPVCSAWFTESKSVCWETTKVSKVVFSSLFPSPFNGQTIATATRSRRYSCQFPAQTNTLQRARHFFYLPRRHFKPIFGLRTFPLFLFLSFRCVILLIFYFSCAINLFLFFVFIGIRLFLFLVFSFWRILLSGKCIFLNTRFKLHWSLCQPTDCIITARARDSGHPGRLIMQKRCFLYFSEALSWPCMALNDCFFCSQLVLKTQSTFGDVLVRCLHWKRSRFERLSPLPESPVSCGRGQASWPEQQIKGDIFKRTNPSHAGGIW